MFANQPVEQIDREQLRALQLTRLQKQLKWAEEKSSFYRRHFQAAGVTSKDVNSLADIAKLPLLTLEKLYQIDTMDIVTLPLSAAIRFNVTKQAEKTWVKVYTNGDVARHVELMTRCLVAVGVNNASIVALQGDFTDSKVLDIQYALEMIGATVVPMGLDYKQWMEVYESIHCDTLITTPALMMQVSIHLRAQGCKLEGATLKRVICMNSQGLTNALHYHITTTTGAKVYNLYTPTELNLGSLLYQCEKHNGYHIQEDCFYPELLAFGSDKVINEPNVMGELVVTSLVAEAMPLIRYRTGQSVMMTHEPCACGRTLSRVVTPLSSCNY